MPRDPRDHLRRAATAVPSARQEVERAATAVDEERRRQAEARRLLREIRPVSPPEVGRGPQ